MEELRNKKEKRSFTPEEEKALITGWLDTEQMRKQTSSTWGVDGGNDEVLDWKKSVLEKHKEEVFGSLLAKGDWYSLHRIADLLWSLCEGDNRSIKLSKDQFNVLRESTVYFSPATKYDSEVNDLLNAEGSIMVKPVVAGTLLLEPVIGKVIV